MATINELMQELEHEARTTRRVLERVPSDRLDWKPHDKSMPLGRLAGLVASMPSWAPLIIEQDELNLTPPPGQGQYQQPSMDELVAVHEKHMTAARASLASRSDPRSSRA